MLKTETLKLKLEAGKKYVDRRGRVFGPLAICGQFFCESSRMPMWYENGRIGSAREADTDMDLVAEHIEPEPAEPEPCPAEPNQSILDACCGSCDRYTAEQLQIKPAEPIIASLHNDCECCGPFESVEPVEFQVEIVNPGEPQRGQFWSYNSYRKYCVFMIGKNIDGHWVAVNRNGDYEVFSGLGNMSFEYWHHEPGLMNFDGPVEPEKPSPSSAEKEEDFELENGEVDEFDPPWPVEDSSPSSLKIHKYQGVDWGTGDSIHAEVDIVQEIHQEPIPSPTLQPIPADPVQQAEPKQQQPHARDIKKEDDAFLNAIDAAHRLKENNYGFGNEDRRCMSRVIDLETIAKQWASEHPELAEMIGIIADHS